LKIIEIWDFDFCFFKVISIKVLFPKMHYLPPLALMEAASPDLEKQGFLP